MTLDLSDLERQTLSHQVVRRLTDSIVAGQPEPGAPLPPEKALAESLRVSRMVIRESVRILAAQGLVDVRHGVGTFVNPPSAWRVEEPLTLLLRAERQSLLHWLEVRRVIEMGFAGLAAEHAREQNLEALTAAISAMRANAERPRIAVEADLEFHAEVARATGNPLALTLIRPVLRPLRDHLVATVGLPQALARAIAEHETIRDAIAARDPELAAAAMRAHLGRVKDEIEALHSDGSAPVVAPALDRPELGGGTAVRTGRDRQDPG